MPSRTLNCTPRETWLAWQLDEAVRSFGDAIEDRRWVYDKKTGAKIDDRLQKLLGETQPKKAKPLINSQATLTAFDAFLGSRR